MAEVGKKNPLFFASSKEKQLAPQGGGGHDCFYHPTWRIYTTSLYKGMLRDVLGALEEMLPFMLKS